MTGFKFSRSSKINMRGINPSLILLAKDAIHLTVVDFGIPSTGGLRSKELQKSIFDQFKSPCDGTEVKSAHQSGEALDFFAYVNGKVSYDRLHLALVASAFLQSAAKNGIGLEWGGLWVSCPAYGHVQLT